LLNQFGSAVEGYDPQLAELLAKGIARAVENAYRARRPAVAAWGQTAVWGHTQNRSYGAYEKNQPPRFQPAFPPPPDRELTPEETAVDPTWTMLRVDTLASDGNPVPAGALSVFAIHGTGNPTSNDLYDSDIHGLASKRIELYIDELNNVTGSRVPRAVHLFANGTQGDVSANWPPESRCEPLRLVRGHRPGGPRTPAPLGRWYSPTRKLGEECLGVARDYIDSVADSLAAHARKLYQRLGDQLGGALSIRRAFWTVPLRGEDAPEDLCDEPRIGTAFAAGAEDGRSHAYRWKALGLFPLGIEEGGYAIRSGEHGCHTPKRLGLSYWVQGKFFVKTHGLPRTAQLAALQIGDMLLGVVPGEVTTTAGYRMVKALRERAASAGLDVKNTAIIGLANGYLQYLTTPEEYGQQHYEGGSMLYGPQSAVVFTRLLGDLVDSLAVGGSAHLDPYPINPGAATTIVDLEASGPEVRSIEEAYCSGDTAIVHWLDGPPGALVPARGPVLDFTLSRPDGTRLEAWDDDPDLEVRALRGRGDRHLWEARWMPPAGAPGEYSFRLIRARPPGNSISFSCR
jgi:neutral ceramidase